jgi:protein-tyrosine phosphatase
VQDPECYERVLPLESVQNFRDLGGYATADGRRVRWRRLFRSGTMSPLSAADTDRLHALEIKAICDLRTNAERERHPTLWCEGTKTALWHRDHERSSGVIASLLNRAALTESDTRAIIEEAYRTMAFEQAPSYRALFLMIAAGQVPLVFNCSAGKDRTGIIAALILSLIGVPRQAVLEDYLLSNANVARLRTHLESDPRYGPFIMSAGDAALPLLRAEASYLAVMFDSIEQRHGSVEGYLRNALELPKETLPAIRKVLLD